jgi:TolA-binding protein
MKSPQEYPQEPVIHPSQPTHAPVLAEALDFEQSLVEVERSLEELKSRYQQIQTDQQQQQDLQKQQADLQQQLKQAPDPALQTKLKDRLAELEVNLESRLISWLSLRERFWQVVRFLGLGMAIGWLFAFATIRSPKPVPEMTTPTTQAP